MEKDYVIIQLYDDEFNNKYIIKKDEDFEKKYEKLVELCGKYEYFDEVQDFINENFETIGLETRYIEV